MKEGMKRYIYTPAYVIEAEGIDEARNVAEAINECAAKGNSALVSGTVHLAREREPVEEFHFGGEAAFLNRNAELGWTETELPAGRAGATP